ncbi:hypothetical protein L1987_66570 [Smallanthus sonchifolius]|uniref:Uncharacterized protein n=1 Tax=Smallanthus sonchifolius TaxID=185202 RepID=A0ACB9BXH6_9ASTR|nr:hypothetical protein L1987_66570 [Smallanthus sonchifolius]
MTTEEPVVVAEVAAPAIKAAATVVVHKEPTMEAALGKSQKGKKIISSKHKTTVPSLHPPYFDMIKDAILSLKDKTGSSQYAIAKFVEEKQKNLPKKFKKILLIQLKRLVAQGKLVKVKASYKLPKPASKKGSVKEPATKPKSAPKSKPKTVVKPKPGAIAAAAVAPKRKPKTPTRPTKVARTSTRSTP